MKHEGGGTDLSDSMLQSSIDNHPFEGIAARHEVEMVLEQMNRNRRSESNASQDAADRDQESSYSNLNEEKKVNISNLSDLVPEQDESFNNDYEN